MTKPRVPKERHEADWKDHDQELATYPVIYDDEWQAIFSHRVFRQGTESAVKAAITTALVGFLRMNSSYNNREEYKASLQELLTTTRLAHDQAYALEKYGLQHLLATIRISDIDKDFQQLVLRRKPTEDFCEAARALVQSIRDLLSSMGKSKSGPATDDIYWLVRMLNNIVLRFSDWGPITRSTKSRSGVGNDRRFVEDVLAIAGRESGRDIGPSSIDGAIRNLKRPKNAE